MQAEGGLDAFNVGTSNLMSSRVLRQMFDVNERTGKTTLRNISDVLGTRGVTMLDVETSGIFRGSQIVQMATADISSSGKITSGINMSFQSEQLGGMMYGEGRPFSELFGAGVKPVDVISSANGGKDFLDRSTKLINDLIKKDNVIMGHNINFDIEKLTSTMKQMGGYSNHKGAQSAVDTLLTRISDGTTTIVDTLEYNRAYMNDLTNQAVEKEMAGKIFSSPAERDLEMGKLHRRYMYSPETMADTRIGGGAVSASVEAITLNTDITARIVRDARAGDESAQVLLAKLTGAGEGSHLADADVLLQSYINKYTTISDPSERLQLGRNDKGGRSAVYTALSKEDRLIADEMRSTVYKSSALVPTKNIANVKHLSKQALDYAASDAGLQGVVFSYQTKAEEGKGILGNIRYDKEEERFVRETSEGTKRYVGGRGKLIDALSGKGGRIGVRNFGITYAENSGALEIGKLMSHISSVSENLTSENILGSIGNIYSNFSSEQSLSEKIKIAFSGRSDITNFNVGFNQNTTEAYMAGAMRTAEAGARVGGPYNFLDTRSKVFNTIMAEGTQQNAEAARLDLRARMSKEGISDIEKESLEKQIKSLSYASDMDIFTETGISHFKKQKEFVDIFKRGADGTLGTRSKTILPAEILQSTLENMGRKVEEGVLSYSISNRKDGDLINLLWSLGSDAKTKDYVPIARQLIDDSIRGIGENTADDLVAGQLNRMGMHFDSIIKTGMSDGRTRDQVLGEVTEMLAEHMQQNGIVYGFQGGEEATRTISNLARAGFELENERRVTQVAGHLDFIGDTIRVGASVDAKAMAISEMAIGGISEPTMKAANRDAIPHLNRMAEKINELGIGGRARQKMTRAKMGGEASSVLSFFVGHKPQVYGTAGAIVGAGAAYYMYKRYKSNQIYNETMDQQPEENYSPAKMMSDTSSSNISSSSFRSDSLSTAGVVGELNRNKINHYRMGPNKNAHLFGG